MVLAWHGAVVVGGARRVAALGSVLLFALGMSASRRAGAQTGTLAESLFRDARVAMKAGHPERACPLFAESYRLDPTHGTLFNLGACEEARGRLASAWAAFRKLVDVAPPDDERVLEASSRLTALEGRVPRVRITVPYPLPPDHFLELDGVTLGPGALEGLLRVDPGTHTLRVTFAGETVRSRELTVAAGERLTYEVEPLVVPPRTAAPEPGAATPAKAPHQRAAPRPLPGSRVGAYTALGLGGAGLGASVVLGVLAIRARDVTEVHCRDQLCDEEGMAAGERGAGYAALATASAVAGFVGLAAGGLLLWRASEDAVVVGLAPSGLRVEGTF
jgi:hypothetical protein